MPSTENVAYLANVISIDVKHRQNIATFPTILTIFPRRYILDGKGKKKNLTWVRVEDWFVQCSGQEGSATLASLGSPAVLRVEQTSLPPPPM